MKETVTENGKVTYNFAFRLKNSAKRGSPSSYWVIPYQVI
nr:MAG TPA: hypothetical protein [Caudoviricetes sp.]